jgi:hypothetical protein
LTASAQFSRGGVLSREVSSYLFYYMPCSRPEQPPADCRSKNVHHFPFINMEVERNLGMKYALRPIHLGKPHQRRQPSAGSQPICTVNAFQGPKFVHSLVSNSMPLADRLAPAAKSAGLYSKTTIENLESILKVTTISARSHKIAPESWEAGPNTLMCQ